MGIAGLGISTGEVGYSLTAVKLERGIQAGTPSRNLPAVATGFPGTQGSLVEPAKHLHISVTPENTPNLLLAVLETGCFQAIALCPQA